MNKDRDTQKTPANSGNSVSSEVKTIKVKQGIWRTYDATDGLPGQVRRLLQDSWGYLWIGTNAGLCRYDGSGFFTHTTSDGLIDNDLEALCEDNQGRLWISTSRGLSCFDGKEFTNYTTDDGLPDNNTGALCIDNQGKLWIGTPQGLSCFHDNVFTNYTTSDGLLDNEVVALCPGRQSGIWIGTRSGISRLDSNRITTLATDMTAERKLPSMWEDSQGQLWIAAGKGIHCFDGQQFKLYTYDDGFVDIQNIVLSICEDRQGGMWFGAWAGVSRFDGSQFTNYSEELWSGGIFDIIEDMEGQMWFAHGQLCGLSCYDAQSISLLTDSTADWVSIQDRKGRVWCGSIRIGVLGLRLDPESSEVEERRIPFIWGGIHFFLDSRDQLWISPFRDGVYCYESSDAAWEAAGGNESYKRRHFGISDSLADWAYASPLLEMEDGTIWFRLYLLSRLSRFDPDQLPDGEPLESIDTKGPVDCLIKDSRGTLWMGGQNRTGLSCWDGKELITYTRENGLPSDHILSLLEDDSGNIWIGTTHGLCCFDGQEFITYGEEYGLKDLYHHWQSVKDTSGQLWFATRGGVYRTDGKHFQWLTEDDGLPNNNVNAVLPQSDGSMIICTNKGIVRYRPTATLPPRVEIHEAIADEVYQNPDEIELTITSASLLIISHHGMSLATRRMRYSYILEGYDKEWHETWDTQVRYENLPLGEYTFKVIAINRDLVTSEAPATLKLTIRPDPRDAKISFMQTEIDYLRREVESKYQFEDIIGQSNDIRIVRALMERAIDSGLTVLITGETGTGKELVAKAIHYNSARRSGPLLDYNCTAATKELINDHLFGHRKGAFTDARDDREGLFEAASGGTLLLDEIGDMPQDTQSILLRVLEERKVQRIGEHTSRDVDVQIIAMTNRDLLREVQEGRFREDLFHRLNEFPIPIPPLREHPEDIPILAEHFIKEYSKEHKKELDGFAPGVLEMLKGYSWPGNVRELRNAIRRAAALTEEGKQIQKYHFASDITQGESLIQEILSEQRGLSASVERLKRRMVEDALSKCDGNRSQAARMLNMHRPALINLMKRLEIK